MSKQQRTIKISITDKLSSHDKALIDATLRNAAIVFDVFTKLGNAHKSVSYPTMHKYGYEECKLKCPHMNTSTIQAVAKSALWSIKTWNTVNKKQKWQYKGKRTATSYPLSNLTLSERGSLYTFSVNGDETHKRGTRVRVLLNLPQWFTEKYPKRKLQAGHVLIDKFGKYFLCLIYDVEFDVSRELDEKLHIVGIDRGLYHAVATSDGFLYSSQRIRAVERRYLYNRRQLQAKGTRSAKRHLRKMSGREKRFKTDVDHCLTSYLAQQEDVSCYVLENLSKISQWPKNKRPSTNPNKVYRSKRYNKWIRSWSPYRFETFLKYKCESRGIKVVKVNPAYTSQICSVCGNIDKEARNKNHYCCPVCGHTEHSDLNAAKNIRDRYSHLSTLVSRAGRLQPSNRVIVDDINTDSNL